MINVCSVSAYNYSGGYFNPMLATSLKYRCSGSTALEHILVYWVGSCTGAIASVYLCQMNKDK